jgi:hypothetical protein
VPPHPAAQSAAGCGGTLEDELCPDEIGGWTVQDASFACCTQFGNDRIKGLILGAGGDILLGQDGQKPFQFMFTWQMQGQPFEEVAISPEPGAVSALGRERKMLASNSFRKPPHRFIRIHLANVIYEQPVVY